LRAQNVLCAEIGEVVPAQEGISVSSQADGTRPLVHPKTDPFWIKFEELLKAGEK
jgi:hydrogenase maturation factor